MPSHREALRGIRTFPQLIKFLRDEMDWPIESDDFEELTFDYTPEELGIETAVAAKIEKNGIKRLRPLTANQPWGIFFVKFEPKRLPVVALRRVLSRVVLKKRASANSADRAAWRADDLLFISNYGEGDDRQISFAHFSTHADKADLPTLMVLGWDSDNTALHLDEVADKLTTKLAWPQHLEDVAHWREQWRAAFTLRHREVITTSKALAERLADLARSIRQRVNAVLKIESDKGPLRRLHRAFRDALIHDLAEDDFADMYAQTIAYGLLTARVSRPSGLVAENLSDMVPVTNPFLKDLLDSFLSAGGRKGKVDFDELGISEVVELLRDANMEAVLRDFGDRNPEEDPAIHFYELFLKEYDPKNRMQRGVFYTPRPVVSYIVRSVHELLQTEFGLEDGLASTVTWDEMAKRHMGIKIPADVALDSAFVQVLDPATGTATFLVEVIDVIYRTLTAKWQGQRLTESQQSTAWNEYVPKHLLPRVHGYELMMAPYAIAHMKIGLKLFETGYRFGSNERARIYLTNALEPPSDHKQQREFTEWAPALAHEAQAVNAIKRHQRFTVIIGNPPYAQYSMNLDDVAKAHINKFRFANGHKVRARNALQLERNLNDDYVKFLGMSSDIFPTATGILGIITNRMFLDSESLVGLREWMYSNFNRVWVVDLWGSSEESRRVARLTGDENVFDILQGVAISFWACRRPNPGTAKPVAFREVIGQRTYKYSLLSDDLELNGDGWDEILPVPKDWWLSRNATSHGSGEQEFTLPEIFPRYSTLVASNRDHLVVDYDANVVQENISLVQAFRGSDEKLAERFNITLKAGWNVSAARQKLAKIRKISDFIQDIEYRPFDRRSIFFDPTLVWQMAPVCSNNVLRGRSNRVLISLGKNRAETINGQWITATLADKSVVSTRDNASGFPLYLYDCDEELGFSGAEGRPNLSPEFLRQISVLFGLPQVGNFGLPKGLSPEDILHYIYAVVQSEGYRKRYAEFLKSDFPRLPFTQSLELFRKLVRLGSELVALHLLESPRLDKSVTHYIGPSNPEVEKISHARTAVWLDKQQTRGFRDVSEAVWNFQVGGYQVCEKWLKDRRGRTLSQKDIAHYSKIIVALNETIRIMSEIDRVIETHGGWPGAFTVVKG
jgi:predicted helicase